MVESLQDSFKRYWIQMNSGSSSIDHGSQPVVLCGYITKIFCLSRVMLLAIKRFRQYMIPRYCNLLFYDYIFLTEEAVMLPNVCVHITNSYSVARIGRPFESSNRVQGKSGANIKEVTSHVDMWWKWYARVIGWRHADEITQINTQKNKKYMVWYYIQD